MSLDVRQRVGISKRSKGDKGRSDGGGLHGGRGLLFWETGWGTLDPRAWRALYPLNLQCPVISVSPACLPAICGARFEIPSRCRHGNYIEGEFIPDANFVSISLPFALSLLIAWTALGALSIPCEY